MLSEQDEELLEAYLDDALSHDEVERTARRLADEPALAAELDALRQQRRVRAAAFASLEPTEAEASAFAASVVRGIHRERMKFRMSWVTRLSGAAAACILMGLGGGWYLWGRSAPSSVVQSPVTPVAVNTQNNSASTGNARGQIQFGNMANELPAAPYQVELTDDHGTVVAVQKFDKLEEAQHFAQDLGQVEERRQDVQNGHVTLVSDHF
jgi:anti-sigma factor RsiW